MKKMFSFILACFILVSTAVLPLTGCADEVKSNTPSYSAEKSGVTEDGLEYVIESNDEAVIIGYLGEPETVDIPQYIGDKKVTAIGTAAFAECSSLKSITFPEGLKSIRSGAFVECKNLHSAFIPKSVEQIGYCALGSCYDEYFDDETGEIYIDYTIDYDDIFEIYGYSGTAAEKYCENEYTSSCGLFFFDVEEYIDENCVRYKLNSDGEYVVKGIRYYRDRSGHNYSEDLKLLGNINGHKVTAIDECAFEGDYIMTMDIPGEIETIKSGAFYNCWNLQSLTLGEGIKTIENDAFVECISLKDVTIPKSVEEIGELNFGFYYNIVVTEDGEHMKLFCDPIVIRGYRNTAAEKYAAAHEEIAFADLDEKIILGDMDKDEKITAADSLDILRASVGLNNLTPNMVTAADIDRDGEITSVDALFVLRKSVGYDDKYEIGKMV